MTRPQVKGRPRKRGKCPECGRIFAVMKGSGPRAQGRGDVIHHKVEDCGNRVWCCGGRALEVSE